MKVQENGNTVRASFSSTITDQICGGIPEDVQARSPIPRNARCVCSDTTTAA